MASEYRSDDMNIVMKEIRQMFIGNFGIILLFIIVGSFTKSPLFFIFLPLLTLVPTFSEFKNRNSGGGYFLYKLPIGREKVFILKYTLWFIYFVLTTMMFFKLSSTEQITYHGKIFTSALTFFMANLVIYELTINELSEIYFEKKIGKIIKISMLLLFFISITLQVASRMTISSIHLEKVDSFLSIIPHIFLILSFLLIFSLYLTISGGNRSVIVNRRNMTPFWRLFFNEWRNYRRPFMIILGISIVLRIIFSLFGEGSSSELAISLSAVMIGSIFLPIVPFFNNYTENTIRRTMVLPIKKGKIFLAYILSSLLILLFLYIPNMFFTWLFCGKNFDFINYALHLLGVGISISLTISYISLTIFIHKLGRLSFSEKVGIFLFIIIYILIPWILLHEISYSTKITIKFANMLSIYGWNIILTLGIFIPIFLLTPYMKR